MAVNNIEPALQVCGLHGEMQLIQITWLLGYQPQFVDMDAGRLHAYLLGEDVQFALIGKTFRHLDSIALRSTGCDESTDQQCNFHDLTMCENLHP